MYRYWYLPRDMVKDIQTYYEELLQLKNKI